MFGRITRFFTALRIIWRQAKINAIAAIPPQKTEADLDLMPKMVEDLVTWNRKDAPMNTAILHIEPDPEQAKQVLEESRIDYTAPTREQAREALIAYNKKHNLR